MTRPVRVMHVVNSLALGGGERTVRDLALNHSPRFRPEVVCLFRDGEMADEVRAAGVPVDVLGATAGRHGTVLTALLRAMREHRPDIVHTHLPEAGWYGLPAARAARVPVRLSHLQNCQHTWGRKLRIIDRAAATCGDHFIACARAVADYYVSDVHYPRRKITVVPNAVDLARFTTMPDRHAARRALDIPEPAFVLVCVAALIPQKDHVTLLRAAASLRRDIPSLVVLLAGEGQERPQLEASIESLGLAGVVRLLGARRDVPALLAASDVFVLTSRWEGLPLVLAEAAAAGLPVVASRVDGVPEIVDDGVTGVLVPPGAPDEVARAVRDLATDATRRKQLAVAARRRAADFSVEALVTGVEAVYSDRLP